MQDTERNSTVKNNPDGIFEFVVFVDDKKKNQTATAELKKFYSNLEKARNSANWYRATNYARG